jgi:hypothetical protein
VEAGLDSVSRDLVLETGYVVVDAVDKGSFPPLIGTFAYDAVDAIPMWEKPVETEFVADDEIQGQTSANTQGNAQDIDKAIETMTADIAHGHLEIVKEHGGRFG